MKTRSAIEILIDAACGHDPDATPESVGLPAEQKEACIQLGRDVLSDLRFAYPEVVKTRPTTWPLHLRNTIAKKAEMMLRDILENMNDKPTPRTDDQAVRYYDDATGRRIEYVAARFARQLERERDEARERADTMFAKHVDILDQTRNERDVWKHNAKIVDEERKAEHENAIDMFIELHDLRHAVKILKTAKGRFHTEQATHKLFGLLP